MSLRLEMLQVARLAEPLLGDSAALVRRFLSRQRNRDGGFSDRTGKSDLYYTVFGLDSLLSLRADIDWRLTEQYLIGFGNGERLDFVHLCCLVRGWSVVAYVNPNAAIPPAVRDLALNRLAAHRTPEGGFHPVVGAGSGTAYAAFLAVGAYQDLRTPIPASLDLVQSFKLLETRDGAWTNERLPLPAGSRAMDMGSTNATAAAVSVLRQLRMPINRDIGQWLLDRVHSSGGFLAMPTAPIPDLLSTATSLHALSGLERSTDGIQERCLDFIDTLWTNEGSFHGNWTEDTLDTEYTFYGLLALGHLAV